MSFETHEENIRLVNINGSFFRKSTKITQIDRNNNNNSKEEKKDVIGNCIPEKFKKPIQLKIPQNLQIVPSVPGLILQTNIMTEKTEKDIIEFLDTQLEWSSSIIRRTIHRGREFNYRTIQLDDAPPMEPFILSIANHLSRTDIFGTVPDQLIINEYYQKQGISAHIDNRELFGPVVVSISLGEDCNFIMKKKNANETKEILLKVPRRSMLVLKGESRYEWSHQIPKMEYIQEGEEKIPKSENFRRVSLTFRTVKKN